MSTVLRNAKTRLPRADALIAGAITLAFLAAYVRTLAPDLLYGDSGEFQTLAYTLGTTHTTGYPIYLLLARAVALIPVESFAWRVNFTSALCAAVTLGLVWCAIRALLAHRADAPGVQRIAASLAVLALGISTTFWSQAIIAEVYTPSTAFFSAALLLLIMWNGAPARRKPALFAAGLILGLSAGVHAGSALLAPPAAVFVAIQVMRQCEGRAGALLAGAGGLALGLIGCISTALLLEINNPPSSFMRAAMLPSRSAWGLSAADVDSPLERVWITARGLQWQPVMFPGWGSFVTATGLYLLRIGWLEFSALVPALALAGLIGLRRFAGALGGLIAGALAFMLIMVLNHQPGDQEVFFLPSYVLLTMLAGIGAARLLGALACRSHVLMVAAALLAAAGIAAPFAGSRADALRSGMATFFGSKYVYEVRKPGSARAYAESTLHGLPPNALALVAWRGMYALFYVAHVEGARPDVAFLEATPYGTGGDLADSMVELMRETLRAGRPVVMDQDYAAAKRAFFVRRIPDTSWWAVSLR